MAARADDGTSARAAEVSWPRLFASVLATTTGLAFWWGLTEPLPVPPAILFAVAGGILFCAGLIAGRTGVLAAPLALLFSLFVGSIIATQLHQAFRPSFPPVSRFGGVIGLEFPDLLAPLALATIVGALGGLLGERLLPSRRERWR